MSDAIRHRVAGELENLNSRGNDLHVDARHSTWRMYGDTPERLRVWNAIIDEFLAEQTDVELRGELIVVTAGPPGAGKSTAMEQISITKGCRRIDPDRLKEMIIEKAIEDRIYEHLLQRNLADGRPIMPLELSGLVHEESVRLADEIKRRCLRAGENLLVEGTLNWEGMIDVYVKDLARHGYDNLGIVSVDVPLGVALERAADRWWLARSDASNLNGGRFVPRAVVVASYTDDGQARGSANAAELARRARRAGFVVKFEPFSGAGSLTIGKRPPEMNADSARDRIEPGHRPPAS